MLAAGDSEFARLGDALEDLRGDLTEFAAARADALSAVHPVFRQSARNLLHYVALRHRDVRDLQYRLALVGLSSLGRCECHVLSAVDVVLAITRRLTNEPTPSGPREDSPGLREGRDLLAGHTAALFGEPPATHRVRVMVTMPADAATDYTLVRALLRGGMDCMRVNCAHDDPDAWARMAGHLQRARRELGKPCRLYMDVAGPKLRTGELGKLPAVVRIRPRRDRRGVVTAPARVLLHPLEADARGADAKTVLPLPAAWLASCPPGAVVHFEDARGSHRKLRIVATEGAARWAVANKTAYVAEGTTLELSPPNGEGDPIPAAVGALPGEDVVLVVHRGDRLVLTKDSAPGRDAVRADDGHALAPASIPCTLPEVFARVRHGDRILFDDGRIGGVVRGAHEDRLEVEITRARPRGERLRSDKGINLPDSDLRLPPLTSKDIEDLPAIAQHADIVGYSFVRSPEGVHELSRRLDELGREDAGLVLKIESRPSFERLPELLLAVMRRPRAGVMIARGDLAVECGFERLAEIQEEILWICEAAHVPVIWATAVLDQLAKRGAPTRAEITDAAMSERAECVMLNKGPHILEALAALDDILRRMGSHQSKKSALLRRLRSW